MGGYLVFPSHSRYFDHLVSACGQLRNYYGTAAVPVYPVRVITMKRGYLFENGAGEYGEFERGDRFLMFGGSCMQASESLFFHESFPTGEIRRECDWEGNPYRTNIIAIDVSMDAQLSRIMGGLDIESPRTENNWILCESFRYYLGTHLMVPEGITEHGNQ